MDPEIITTIGLIFGIIGVLMVFVWGPPQPTLTQGASLGLENGTPIDATGRTVADRNRKVAKRRRTYTRMSRLGLILIMIGFALQLLAVWLPTNALEKPGETPAQQISFDLNQKKANHCSRANT